MFLQDKLFVLFERLNLHNILDLHLSKMFVQHLVDRFLEHMEFGLKIHQYLCNILHLHYYRKFVLLKIDRSLLHILFVMFDQL